METPRGLQFDENVEVRNIQEGGSLDQTLNTMMTADSRASNTSGSKGGSQFIKKLDNLQNEQTEMTQKSQKERRKQHRLNDRIDELQRTVLSLQAATNNGARVVEDERACQKAVHRLEHKLEKLRTKVSLIRTENKKKVHAINEQRKDKNLQLEVLHGLEKETDRVKNFISDGNREIGEMNESKHKAKMELSRLKAQMITDMESFKKEMSNASKALNDNQEAMMQGIKEKMELANLAASISVPDQQAEDNDFVDYVEPDTEAILSELLASVEMTSLEELMGAIHSMEKDEFRMYTDLQELSVEVEEVEVKHKGLSKELHEVTKKVDGLEGANNDRREDLEKHIKSIEGQVAQHEVEYKENMAVIAGLSESLHSMLSSIAIESNVQDQQLLSQGINDRNLGEFLGLVEGRIDFLMQLDKAAKKQALRREDFAQGEVVISGAGVQPPTIPSMDDAGDEDGDEDDAAKVLPVDIKSVKEFMDKKLFPHKHRKGFQKGGRKLSSKGKQSTLPGTFGPPSAHTPEPPSAGVVEEGISEVGPEVPSPESPEKESAVRPAEPA